MLLVTDSIYPKTKRHIEKIRSLIGDDRLSVLLIRDKGDPFFQRTGEYLSDLEVLIEEVDSLESLYRFFASNTTPADEISVLALNQSALLPGLAVLAVLGRSFRPGILESCDKGIMRSRLQPVPNLRLDHYVVLGDDVPPARAPFEPGPYIVKPCLGTSSRDVYRAQSWDEIRRVIPLWQGSCKWLPDWIGALLGLTRPSIGAFIVERFIEGTEFSVDGWIGDDFDAIVQQKLWTFEQPFFGDGLTISPPACSACLPADYNALKTREDNIVYFARSILEAIGLRNGVFHIEGRECRSSGALRLIEVNPRAPGGSLWRSALLRMNCDLELMDAALQLGYPYPKLADAPAKHVLHYPFYAMQSGTLQDWGGLDGPFRLPNLKIDKVATLKQSFYSDRVREEAYLAFAVTHDDTLEALLAQGQEILRLRRPQILQNPLMGT
ncbi:ATP-grasp domain-containing protein [Methylocapsa acidiphila]|uniref:ATP-grasp domain-containing protein n=1 Tax=Methylocapsa acidiphila TaxID=133552 RepID=UPI0012EBE7BE|nr:ATP-grasp domain-containing protein [Methylocapsa acidiphila]